MKKKPSRHFFRLLIVLFIIFTALLIAMESGYYENQLGKKAELTKEKIAEFEQDIKDGKAIDINNYLDTDSTDYSNKMNKAGVNISSNTEKFMTKGIKQIFKLVGTLFG